MKNGDRVVFLELPRYRGTITGTTRDGMLLIEFDNGIGLEAQWEDAYGEIHYYIDSVLFVIHPHNLELEEIYVSTVSGI